MTEALPAHSSKKPTHIAYQVRQAGEQSYWDRIGSAWTNADGKGLNVQLNAVPLDGRLTLRLVPEGQ